MKPRDLRGARVLLVNMPWGAWNEPGLGLGILKAVLTEAGVAVDVYYASLQMLRYVPPSAWKWIGANWGVNDFLFTADFEPQVSPAQIAALRRNATDAKGTLEYSWRATVPPDEEIAAFVRLRQELVPAFLDDVVGQLDLARYDLVGFTSVFEQTFASLALARRIKRCRPDLMVAFGGAALQRPVGPALQRCFEEMDVVSYGDGEPVIVPLVEAAIGLRELADVPNITFRGPGGAVLDSARVEQIDLDTSPTPDFDDFFEQRNRLREQHGLNVVLGAIPIESSRGCWWGQKSHCTFCGILDEDLRYRRKSAQRVMYDLTRIQERYESQGTPRYLRFSDYIMPLDYFKDLLIKLAIKPPAWPLYYETKANLTAERIRICAEAGIGHLQPGIESFSSVVLARMDKGVTAMQNVFALFTMLRYGIVPFYNLIFGFPGDTAEDYKAIIRLLPSLYHIMPPGTCVPVLINRYAPLAEYPERFGGHGPLRADGVYDAIFSPEWRARTGFRTEEYAYYFENPYTDQLQELEALFTVLKYQYQNWTDRFHARRVRLDFVEVEAGIEVRDSRFSTGETLYRFGTVHRAIARAMLDRPRTPQQLGAALEDENLSAPVLRAALEELVHARIVVNEGPDHVWVAFPRACRMPESILEKHPEGIASRADSKPTQPPWETVAWDRSRRKTAPC